ncbi:hypothetical protein FQA39_LY14578 [Lamprigera yunnana]|nr:hypothetical protein FQA39_LY14578 [Lamprigera yunnana]
MNFLFGLSVLLSGLACGLALKCNLCAGSPQSDCALGNPASMVHQDCPPLEGALQDRHFLQCVKLSVTEYYTPHLFIRSCIYVPQNVTDGCDFIGKRIKNEGCETCSSDLCNK